MKNNSTPLSHDQEYTLIKKDLYKVLIINVVFLIALFVLYYANQQSGFLESWFSNIV